LAVLRVPRVPDGVVQAALVRDRGARRSLLTAASLSSAWFGMLVAIPTTLAAAGWSSIQVGLLLIPCAALGLFAPRLTSPVLLRLGPARSQLVAMTGVTGALLLAALGVATATALPLILATLALMLSFGLGQPAMTALVADAVPTRVRGGALGLLTLVFLMGGGLGAGAVGGLGEQIGLDQAVMVLAALPLTAAATFARSLRHLPADRPHVHPTPHEESP